MMLENTPVDILCGSLDWKKTGLLDNFSSILIFDESKIVDGNFTVVLPLDNGFNGQFKFSRIHTVNWLHCSNHELTVKIIDK